MNAVDRALNILLASSGLEENSAIEILSPWCRNPRFISGKLITPAALRDELKKVNLGTAIIEEADEATNIRDCEQLLAARCSLTTGSLMVKEHINDIWRQVSVELYGATIVHYRRAVLDQATASRAITIETSFRDGKYKPPVPVDELGVIFKGLGEAVCSTDVIDIGTDRVHDIWAPILAVARLVKDEDWLKWSNEEIKQEVENLRDEHAYELTGLILSHIIMSLTDEGKNEIVCRQLRVQEDIIEPIRKHERIYLNG
jgi:hypothetical protein